MVGIRRAAGSTVVRMHPGDEPDTTALDPIDTAMASWRRLLPDLDVDTMRTSLLFATAAAAGRSHVEATFERFGITSGEFDVLASLLHTADRVSTPTELARSGMMSPAGMTHRLDVLERDGLVERRPSPNDRRSVQVVLTDAGVDLALEAARAHVEAERELFAPLSDDERRQLERLIARMLAARAELPDTAVVNPEP